MYHHDHVAKPAIADIGHHRAPVVIDQENWETWLTGEPGQAETLLIPPPADEMDTKPITKAVNNPNFDNKSLMAT